MIDSHAHLDDKSYKDDLDRVIKRAWQAGLSAIITIGVDVRTSQKAVDLAEKHSGIRAAVGVHPHEAADCTEDDFAKIDQLLSHPKVVALGEVGLDFFKEYSPRADQERWFRRLCELAIKRDRPLVIHNRDADERTIAILREVSGGQCRGVFHCFSGDVGLARQVLDLGMDLSFTGAITYKNSRDVREVVGMAPADRIHIETDCPYLAPVPFRGKRNEPAYVAEVARMVAEIRGEPLEQIQRQTEANTRSLFSFDQ